MTHSFKLVFVLLLAGCSYNATLVPRGGGQQLVGVYNRAGLEMTTEFEGATYRGSVIQGSSTGFALAGTRVVPGVGMSNQFSSAMVGPQGVIRCEFVLGGFGGNGVCQAPNGTTYDLLLK